jgi:hypothetical protein
MRPADRQRLDSLRDGWPRGSEHLRDQIVTALAGIIDHFDWLERTRRIHAQVAALLDDALAAAAVERKVQ